MGVGSNGMRSQIHLDYRQTVAAHYTRQGTLHTRKLSQEIIESCKPFLPSRNQSMSVIDGEWVPSLNHVFVFDILKFQGERLVGLTYAQRYEFLEALSKKLPEGSHISILPVYKTLDEVMEQLDQVVENPHCEGLVFRAPDSKGWNDTSIVRCRIKGNFKGR